MQYDIYIYMCMSSHDRRNESAAPLIEAACVRVRMVAGTSELSMSQQLPPDPYECNEYTAASKFGNICSRCGSIGGLSMLHMQHVCSIDTNQLNRSQSGRSSNITIVRRLIYGDYVIAWRMRPIV